MVSVYLLAKKAHRMIILPMIMLAVILSSTGAALKFPNVFSSVVDVKQARYLHNQMSLFFSIFLFLMSISGLVMYIYPLINRKSTSKTTLTQTKE